MSRSHAHVAAREKAAYRRQQALQLRLSGASYPTIAQALGVSVSVAYKDVQRELESVKAQHDGERESLLSLELERIDRMMRAHWPQAIQGHQGATDRVLKLMERRARLLGLDAPVKGELSGPGGGPMTFRVVYDDAEDGT